MNKKGFLIAIEGVDASGKQTHSELLYDKLAKDGKAVRKISFPMYDSDSSSLVKMYLSGKFGEKADDVNAYAASTFFAADRFATYHTDWGKDYENGIIIVADRYVSSNMIHQAGKLAGSERDNYLDWVNDFEYGIYALPKPDINIFLDMPPEFGEMLMCERDNKFTKASEKDIHERDFGHLKKSYENACYIAKKYGWTVVSCVKEGKIRSIEDINDELYEIVKSAL